MAHNQGYKQTYKVVFLDNERTEVCFWMVEASNGTQAVKEIQEVIVNNVIMNEQLDHKELMQYIKNPINFAVYPPV